jgi:hypothetical protein
VLHWLLQVWKAYTHRAASYQTRVLLTLVYALILGPAALLNQVFGGQLMDLGTGQRSSWVVRPAQEKTLTALRRQF